MSFLGRFSRVLIFAFGATFALAGAETQQNWSAGTASVGVNVAAPGSGGGPAFVDAMKEATPWASAGRLKLDDLGNVVELAPGQTAETVIYPRGAYAAGDYTLLYDGTGTFALPKASGTIRSRAAGRLVLHVVPSLGYGIHLRLLATDPHDYARHIRLIRPGFIMSYGVSPFDPALVDTLRGLGVVRFSGWAGPALAGRSWSARTLPASFTQASAQGVSAEYMIGLANTAQVNPWFTLPVAASDDYVAHFAQLVATKLDPRLHATFELGDEVWSPGTPANAYAALAGRRSGLAGDATTAAVAWYSARSVQMFAIVDRAFAPSRERPEHVLSGPLARPGTAAASEAAAILRYASAGSHADAFAVAADATPAVRGDASVTSAIASALSGSAGLAHDAHVRLVAYRGGSDGRLTANLLGTWHAAGGALFVADAITAASPATASNLLQGAALMSRLAFDTTAASATATSTLPAVGVPLVSTAPGATLLSESFAGSETPARAWLASGDSCLTAGTATTSSVTSVRACNGAAAHASPGNGALQLTTSAASRTSFLVYRTPFATSRGLDTTFTDYAFDQNAKAGSRVTLFLADAAQLMPASAAMPGGAPAGTYLSITLPTDAVPGSARTMQSIVVRGSGAGGFPALGGSADGNGRPAALAPIRTLAAPTLKGQAPAVRAILTSTGGLTVAVDRHDGNGFVVYYRQQIAGRAGQGSLPDALYLGFTASATATATSASSPQIGNVRVATANPATAFAPTNLTGLTGWYDASNGTTLTKTAAGAVSAWRDSTTYADTLAVPATKSLPTYVASGISGLGAVSFNGTTLLVGSNAAESARLLNESTVFVVGNETPTAQSGDLLFSGAYDVATPVWELRPTGFNNTTFFGFNTETGALTVPKVESGATIWTAGGSVSNASRLFRRNGTTLASSTAAVTRVTGSYPLSVGAMYGGGTKAIYGYRGLVGEIVIYSRYLSTAESTEVEGYLACKWGLQSRLPAGHPYRTACPGGSAPAPTPAPAPTTTPAPTGSPLPNPVQLRSTNGVLSVTVSAAADATTHNPVLTYNGSETPPTLRLSPGNTLVVHLTNNLPKPPAGATYADDVNLHYHGLHVSPNAPADDSIDIVAAPGQTVVYKVPIPTDHPPGLYWYHSHAHGESERQNLSGMSGALVIEGIAKYTPAVTNLAERILIVRDRQPAGTALPPGNLSQIEAMRWSMQTASAKRAGGMSGMPGMAMSSMDEDADMRDASNTGPQNPYVDSNPLYRTFVRPLAADGHCQGSEVASKVWTVNGASAPSIGIKPGEKQFWRLVNAGADTYLDVQLDRASMQIIALDGVPLISGNNTPASMTVSHYVVPPASRIEFIVTGPSAGAKAYLRTNCFDAGATGLAMPAAVLASIDPTTTATAASRNMQLIPAQAQPFRFHTAAFIKAHAASSTQTLYYSEQLQMNGQSYNPSGPPMFYAQVGTTQDWTIINTSTQVHTFHMHQVHFIVESINGVNQSQQFVMDNVNIPAATTSGPGTVKVRLDFTDPLIVGTFLVHCHILSHEDAGMMAKIRVGTAPPIIANPSTVTFSSPTAAAQSVTITGGKAPYSVAGCANVAKAAVKGSAIAITPAGGGSCLLSVEDATGLIATVSVSVTALASPVSLSPTGVSFTSATAGSQTVKITGGALPYAVSGCAGIATGVISGSVVTVAPKAAGTCTFIVSDAKNETASLSVTVNQATTGGNAMDNLTFHQDVLRTGWNQHETSLTTANVTSASFGRLTTLSAPSGQTGFGKIYGQPLYVTNEATSDGKTHNLVIVATSTDQVYAYDDKTYALVWHRSFLNPPSVVQQSWTDTGCYSPGPDVGITGTPVIDRARNRLYAVVATKENGTFHQRIHAILLSNGAEAVNPTDITGTVTLATGGTASVDPEWNLQRPALLESAGNIYVALGSHCDWHSNVIHGWMLAYSAATLQMTGNMFDLSNANDGSNYFLSSIWMSGYGPAADPQGNVYFATGNGPYDGGVNTFGMSVVKIAGTLSRAKGNVSTFAPYGEATDSESDADLGSGGIMLMPDQKGPYAHMVIAGGKCGGGGTGSSGCQKYILNRDNLGGRQANDAGTLWHGNVAGWMWGGPAYFADASGLGHVVYGGGAGWDPFSTFNLNVGPTSLSTQSANSTVGCFVCNRGDPGGSLPVVSSNGTQANSAIVWVIKTPGQSGGTMTLYAFNALKMSSILFTGLAGNWNLPPGASEIPAAANSPLVANGKVYVPVDGAVAVFGLKNASDTAASAARQTAAVSTSVERSSVAAAAGEHVVYGTIVQLDAANLTIRLRDGRQQRVDATAAIASGKYSAPLFVGKTVSIAGSYASDGTLQAVTISKLGRADASAPADH